MNDSINNSYSIRSLRDVVRQSEGELVRAMNRIPFNQTVAGGMLQSTRDRLSAPTEEMPVPPQYGAGSLGALQGLAATLQGPRAVERQGTRIAQSAAERRQVMQYNAQRRDQQQERLTMLDMTMAQYEDQHYRAAEAARKQALAQYAQAATAEGAEAQRLSEKADATAEDKARYADSIQHRDRVQKFSEEVTAIELRLKKQLQNANLTYMERRDLRDEAENERAELMLKYQIGDYESDGISAELRPRIAEASEALAMEINAWMKTLDQDITDEMGNVVQARITDERQVPTAIRKIGESLDDVGARYGDIPDHVLAREKSKAMQRYLERLYQRAEAGEIGTFSRANIPMKRGENEAQYEIRRERSEALANERLPLAMERIASVLNVAGIPSDAGQLLSSMPPGLRDAWREADITRTPLDPKVVNDYRDWFESNQVPMPGETFPAELVDTDSLGSEFTAGASFSSVITRPQRDVFGAKTPYGKVVLDPNSIVGEQFPEDVFSVGRGYLNQAAKDFGNAPNALDPFAGSPQLLNDMIDTMATLTTDLFYSRPGVGITEEDLAGSRAAAREQVLRNQTSNVQ